MRILGALARVNGLVTGSSLLIVALMLANGLNFLFNAYFGRLLPFEEFGVLTLMSTVSYLVIIPVTAFSASVTHQLVVLLAKKCDKTAALFLKQANKRMFRLAVYAMGVWLLVTPLLAWYFHVENYLLVGAMGLAIFAACAMATRRGYLFGTFSFKRSAIVVLTEPTVKLVVAQILYSVGLTDFVALAIPISLAMTLLVCIGMVKLPNAAGRLSTGAKFPTLFFISSLITSLAMLAFFTFDIMIIKHYLSAYEAGQYAFLSLTGKMVYFLGSLATVLATAFGSRDFGSNATSNAVFYRLLLFTTLMTGIAFFGIGVFGYLTLPWLFGHKAYDILLYVVPYTFAIALLTIGNAVTTYYTAKRQYVFSYLALFSAIAMVFGISMFHKNLPQVVSVIIVVSLFYAYVLAILWFVTNRFGFLIPKIDIFDVFSPSPKPTTIQRDAKTVVIFNWRDCKHKWAGGAENYLHELAKIWVINGMRVIVFCGNDGTKKRYEINDGVEIIRRGGFYTVYIWAAIYYLTKLRHYADIVIDSENGIPFFTPLYVRKPKLLLIHHIHQEVFRASLPFMKAKFAQLLEAKVMPLVYRSIDIITVSPSSQEAIAKTMCLKDARITVIYPGITLPEIITHKKSKYPTVVYVGRLKPYKRIDVAISAFAKVVEKHKKAKLLIAGSGESLADLKLLANKLGVANSVEFMGKVTEEHKAMLYSQAWIAVQPSMMEGWGITVIEANSYGTPVVASYVNGLKDSVITGRTGVLVSAGSVHAFAAAITTLLEHKQLRNIYGKNARKWAEKFPWDQSATQLYDLLMTKLPVQKSDVVIGDLAIAE